MNESMDTEFSTFVNYRTEQWRMGMMDDVTPRYRRQEWYGPSGNTVAQCFNCVSVFEKQIVDTEKNP
jgi:hypothetical protein